MTDAIGWDALQNGALLDAAEAAGFDVPVTADQNIRHQQNLTGRTLALVVLESNHWPTLKRGAAAIRKAAESAARGSVVTVAFDLAPLRRRLRTPGGEP